MNKRKLTISITMLSVAGGILALFAFHTAHRSPNSERVVIPQETAPLQQATHMPQSAVLVEESSNAHAAPVVNPVVKEPPVPRPRIPNHLLVLFDASRSLSERLKPLEPMKNNALTDDEARALIAALRQDKPRTGQAGVQEHYLQHVIMQRLLHDKTRSATALTGLVAIASDTTLDPVTRDYALQHLGTWGQTATVEEVELIRAALWNGVKQPDFTLAGTSLLGLQRILPRHADDAENETLSHEALRIASDAQFSAASRATALQVASRMNNPQALPVARSLARTETNIPLKLAAMAALGSLGSESDEALLLQMQASTSATIQPALAAAIRQIQSRHALNHHIAQRKDP